MLSLRGLSAATLIENTFSKGGKEVLSRRAVVSKDGKMIRATVREAGKPVAVFEKQ